MKTQKVWRTNFAVLWLATLVAACGGGGIVQPQTFEQQLAYAYSSHTAIMDAAANAVSLGTLSASDGAQVLKIADEAKVLLDSSRLAIGVGDVTTAQGQLTLATNILTQLRDYLNSKSGVQP